MKHNNMRSDQSGSLAPQASASTNSATRAQLSVADDVSQETSATSRGDDNAEKFPTAGIQTEFRTSATGRQIEVYSEHPSHEPPRRRRGRQAWLQCESCRWWYAAAARAGVSNDNMRYRKRQKERARAVEGGRATRVVGAAQEAAVVSAPRPRLSQAMRGNLNRAMWGKATRFDRKHERAWRMALARRTIHEIEHGLVNPKFTTIVRIAVALGLSPSELMP